MALQFEPSSNTPKCLQSIGRMIGDKTLESAQKNVMAQWCRYRHMYQNELRSPINTSVIIAGIRNDRFHKQTSDINSAPVYYKISLSRNDLCKT
jgi:hypothetical protein